MLLCKNRFTMTKHLIHIPFEVIKQFSRVREKIRNIVKNRPHVSLDSAIEQMSKRAPINHPHSASWHKHRNKLESREFWSKERAKEKEELRKTINDLPLDKEERDDRVVP